METPSTDESLANKMWRAAKLDVDLYEEVEADTTATGKAFTVVLISSLASGIGAGLWALLGGELGNFIWGLVAAFVGAVVMWGVFAWLTYFIGTRLFAGPETSADWGELLRTLGFSTAPGVLRILPGIIGLVGLIWMVIAAVIAVRQALDFTTWRAIGTCLVAILPTLLIHGIITAIFF